MTSDLTLGGGIYLDVSDTFNASWPAMRMLAGQVRLERVDTIDLRSVEVIGGYFGLSIAGSARSVNLDGLRAFDVDPAMGSGRYGGVFVLSPRLGALRLPSYNGSAMSRLYFDCQLAGGCELEMGSVPSFVGHPNLDTTSDGGVYLDVSDGYVASLAGMVTVTGNVVVRRVQSFSAPDLKTAALIDVDSPGYVGVLELGGLVGAVGMSVNVRVGSGCTRVGLPALGQGGTLTSVATMEVTKTGSGPFEVDLGSVGGGPREVTKSLIVRCSGGCTIDQPIAGLGLLTNLSGGVGDVYEVSGLNVAGGGAFVQASVGSVSVRNGISVVFENNVGVTKFGAGVGSVVSAGGPLSVRNNSGLVTLCDVVGVNTRSSVVVANNGALNGNCVTGPMSAVCGGACTGNGPPAGACTCP